MIFNIDYTKSPLNYEPVYSKNDQSFSTVPEIPGEFSIMVKGCYTSLDVSIDTSTLCCVSGLNPQKTWIKAKLSYPESIKYAVQVVFDSEPQVGTGVDYALDWKTYYDKKQGVICIGTPLLPTNSVNAEFNTNTCVSIVSGKIVAIWIKPRFFN